MKVFNFGNPKNGVEQISLLAELSVSGIVDKDVSDRMIRLAVRNATYAGATEKGHNYVEEKLFLDGQGGAFGYSYLQNNKIDWTALEWNSNNLLL